MDTKISIGRITVSLTPSVLDVLRRLKARHCCSTSAIVEIALRDYIGRDSEEQVGVRLRAAGAGRRRVQRQQMVIFGGKSHGARRSI